MTGACILISAHKIHIGQCEMHLFPHQFHSYLFFTIYFAMWHLYLWIYVIGWVCEIETANGNVKQTHNSLV